MEEVEFGHLDPVHRQIPWPCEDWKSLHPIGLPKSFIPHLASNDNASPEECALVKEFREIVRTDIKKEEYEIRKAQERLDHLQSRMEVHKKKAFACDVILSPFRRLPLDILHEIAMQCCPSEDLRGKWKAEYETSPIYHSPSGLSGTCKAWRNIVLHLSHLWQFISIDCTLWTSRNMNILTASIVRFSTLSKSLPLAIHLDDFPPINQGHNNIVATGMVIIFNWLVHCWDKTSLNRVHKLSVRPPSAESLTQLLNTYADMQIRLPHIKTFLMKEMTHMGHRESEYSNWELGVHDFFTISNVFPNVRRFWFGQIPGVLSLHKEIFHPLIPAHSVPGDNKKSPFRNITHLYMQPTLDFQDWLYLMSAANNLKLGSFEVDNESHSFHREPPRTRPLIHLRLKELVLNFRNFDRLDILRPFLKIKFPALRHMQLNFRRIHLLPFDPIYTNDLVPEMFLDRFPVLQTLLLGKEVVREELFHFSGLFPLLLSAPSVTALSVFASGLNDIVSFMDFMREKRGDILPNLRSLNVGLNLRDVIEPYESLEQGLTRSLLGTGLNFPCSPSERAMDSVSNSDGSRSSQVQLRSPNRFTEASIQIRLVGTSRRRHGIDYFPDNQVIRAGGFEMQGNHSSRMKAFKAHLLSEHNMDVEIEVDSTSEDGLISDVPFDIQHDDWYIQHF